jgi:hypothetical protein
MKFVAKNALKVIHNPEICQDFFLNFVLFIKYLILTYPFII